ncbi:hypothetical protein CO010_01325 [Candidatus Shapirobacteria bacterium CG_4_8_14_3_um_filter_39_11]|uniref:Glycosyl transferase family 1 domain-containing protein n=3 Tax=Patescibacteria group TaxID=1783273 RepID=A0A2M8EVV2_9BACT|nr:MAG: hypothetical protein CO053_00385 [Candidatus Shapirobacteria bacterium CG_4_9_14_0_2_um_filter_40_11]PJC77009.1 MAG: hypothetical protein CO010_01325 [Candidatus Shapirobacteria bacterium CG_4_8_14_3_um_filter_39_11]
MKLGIFDPYLDTIGGGERYAMTLAEALLKKGWQVDIFWPDGEIKEKLIDKFSLDIERVNFVSYSPRVNNLFKKISFERRYDLLFYFSDGSTPAMFGKKNLLHFQVPFQKVGGRKLSNRLKLKRINKIVCNSFFTKNIIEKEYGVKGEVWYPPVSVEDFSSGKKENIILAVGRFEKSLTEKRQDILVETFKKMVNKGLENWKLVIAGGCSDDENKNEILNNLKKIAQDFSVEIKVNLPFLELKELYAKSKIFWHAAGYGADEEKSPEKVEHFGMTTVEAMSAGCVPIVINKGGQKEIIQNNKDGFLWETSGDLIDLTEKVINDDKLMSSISEEAVKKSRNFSKKKFYEKIYNFIG